MKLKTRMGYVIFSLLALLCFTIGAFAGETITYTDKSVDFYGYGKNLAVGDVVTAYDPDGVLCGRFIVNEKGRYGILHVYGDDVTTHNMDEGAVSGDIISLFVNGTRVNSLTKEIIWTGDGASFRVDF